MTAYLDDEAKSLQTSKIIFGGESQVLSDTRLHKCSSRNELTGCHDNGYMNTMRSLITTGHGKKLALLQGYKSMASGYGGLPLPTLVIPELFEQEKLDEHSAQSVSPVVTAATSFGLRVESPKVPPGLHIERPANMSPISIPASAAPVAYNSLFQTKGVSVKAQSWRRSVAGNFSCRCCVDT